MSSSIDASSATPSRGVTPSRLGVYAWFVLFYTLFVIVYGAWVRVSGSGDGCGDHWPLCHGDLIPQAAETKTWIEYSHRATSGLLGPMCLGLFAWTWFSTPRRARLVRFSLGVGALVVVEALIGAGLVKGGLVAENSSVARAVVVGLHLGNTLLLTAVTTVTAWLASDGPFDWPRGPDRRAERLALLGVIVVSMTGAVTALGDTLFPMSPTVDGGMFSAVRDGLDTGSHFLVRLRVVHPVLACAVALWLIWLSSNWMGACKDDPLRRRLAVAVHASVWAQLVCGFVNVMLSAPAWMQLLHLLLAQVVWLSLVLWSVTPRQTTLAGTLSGPE